MKGLKVFGDLLFEYLIISILLSLSLVLVLPFVPVFVGVIYYFKYPSGERMLKDIFKGIKLNFKILIPYTILEVLLVIGSGLNIFYFQRHNPNDNIVILVISYIGIIVGMILLVNGPMIILNMKVTFIQLLFNSVALVFGGISNSIMLFIGAFGYLVLISFYPFMIPVGLYFLAIGSNYITKRNFTTLKAKKLNITVEELIALESKDDYLDEYGQIKK